MQRVHLTCCGLLAGLALSCAPKEEAPVGLQAKTNASAAVVITPEETELEPPMPEFPPEDSPPRIALLNIRDADRPPPTDDPYAGFTTLVQSQLELNTGHEFVERQDLLAGLKEIELAKLSSAGSSPIRVGKWLKADIVITGKLDIDVAPHHQYSGHVPGPSGSQFPMRLVHGANTGELLKSLDLVATDLRRGTVLARKILRLPIEFSHLVAGSDAAASIAKVAGELIDTAVRRREEIGSRTVIAPLYFQVPENYPEGLLDSVENEFTRMLQDSLNPEQFHILEFSGRGLAKKESELTLLGLVDVNPWAWQRLADIYLWGVVTAGKTTIKIQVKSWNGQGAPTTWSEKVTCRPDSPFPARELGRALERLARNVSVLRKRTQDGPMKDVRKQLSAEFIAPLAYRTERDAGAGRTTYRKNINDWDRAIGVIVPTRLTTAQLRSTIRSAEITAFFDPSNRQIREELMALLDRRKRLWIHQGSPDDVFLSALRWGEHVDRFGLNTAMCEKGLFKSGAKLEPYFHRWIRIWLSTRPEMISMFNRVRMPGLATILQPWKDGSDDWIRGGGEGLREFIRQEAFVRLEKTLRYLSQGQTALPDIRGVSFPWSVDQRMLPGMLQTLVAKECGIVPDDRRTEIEKLLNQAVAMIEGLPRYLNAARPPIPPSDAPSISPSFSLPTRKHLDSLRKIEHHLHTNASPFIPSARLTTNTVLSFQIPTLEIPLLAPTIEPITIPRSWKISHIPRMAVDSEDRLWLLFHQYGRSDGGVMARLDASRKEIKLSMIPPGIRDFGFFKGESWLIGRDLETFTFNGEPGDTIGLLNGLPMSEPISISCGIANMLVANRYNVWMSSDPRKSWRKIPLPASPFPPVVQLVGSTPLIQRPDPMLSIASNWIRLDLRLDGRLDSLRQKGISTARDARGTWLGSPLGLSYLKDGSTEIRHWPIGGRELGVPAAMPTLHRRIVGFSRRMDDWWRQTLSLYALGTGRNSPVRPSPLGKPVTIIHRSGPWLFVGTGNEMLPFHIPNKAWAGRLVFNAKISAISSDSTSLYIALIDRDPPLLRISKTDLLPSVSQLVSDGDASETWRKKMNTRSGDNIKAAFFRGEFQQARQLVVRNPDALPVNERKLVKLIAAFLTDQALAAPKPPSAESSWWAIADLELRATLQSVAEELKDSQNRMASDQNRNGRLEPAERVAFMREPEVAANIRSANRAGPAFAGRALLFYDTDNSGDLSIAEYRQYWLNEIERQAHGKNPTSLINQALRVSMLKHDQNADQRFNVTELSTNHVHAPVGFPMRLPAGQRVHRVSR